MSEFCSTLYAFVDEYGDPNLEVEKGGVSNLYVCVAILVDESEKAKATADVEEIQRSLFSGGEIKSSGIGKKHNRRLRVLRALSPVKFSYYALAVDKEQFWRDSGLQYRTSFYKYLHRGLFQRLLQYTRLEVVADDFGRPDFMESFLAYMETRLMPDLFTSFGHSFKNSRYVPLVQVADLVAGTLARVLDPDLKCDQSSDFHELLKPHEIAVRGWPPRYRSGQSAERLSGTEWDAEVEEMVLRRACQFEEEFGDTEDPSRQMQVTTLARLLYAHDFAERESDKAIYSEALRQHLQDLGYPDISERGFRHRVIGPLRDAGIIIAGTNRGYRLAVSRADVGAYVSHDRRIIEPMLARLREAREGVKLATSNGLDILDSSEFSTIRALCEEFSRREASED